MISIDVKDGRTRTAFLTYIKLYYIAFIHIHLIGDKPNTLTVRSFTKQTPCVGI